MVNFNLTALAVAATSLTIVDFQNHAVDNSLGLSLNNNPVTGNVRQGSVQQQWTFVTTPTPGVFTIQSSSGLFLSYPAAPNDGLQWGQAVLNKFPLSFNVQTVNPATNSVKIVENTFKVVLTAWPAESGSNTSPLTFEADTGRAQQIFDHHDTLSGQKECSMGFGLISGPNHSK
ncbi:hypothetical protein DFH09DRAFT_1314211 [Mycena vulgaris]|nr:hypothetical protein DFH09DRAFT_1314211 [Mycena vulgaris]